MANGKRQCIAVFHQGTTFSELALGREEDRRGIAFFNLVGEGEGYTTKMTNFGNEVIGFGFDWKVYRKVKY